MLGKEKAAEPSRHGAAMGSAKMKQKRLQYAAGKQMECFSRSVNWANRRWLIHSDQTPLNQFWDAPIIFTAESTWVFAEIRPRGYSRHSV